MPGDYRPYFPGNQMLPLTDQMGYCMQNSHMPPFFNGKIMPQITNIPFTNTSIQPSECCPRNFVIFDQTNNRSQVVFHPERNSEFFHPGFGVHAPIIEHNETNISSPLKEDSDDIDALLSEENEEFSDSEVSTARSNAIDECISPDSCSNYETNSKKSKALFGRSSGIWKRREKTRNMVKALRGVVPGANRMNSVDVLDEAVRYLKSLRVQVQKFGLGNSN